jgi:hypothetical protein
MNAAVWLLVGVLGLAIYEYIDTEFCPAGVVEATWNGQTYFGSVSVDPEVRSVYGCQIIWSDDPPGAFYEEVPYASPPMRVWWSRLELVVLVVIALIAIPASLSIWSIRRYLSGTESVDHAS